GSMEQPADIRQKRTKIDPEKPADTGTKIKALHEAASRFVELMPRRARTALLPFSDEVETPEGFSNDKARLERGIRRLEAQGETPLSDATYAALATLEAESPPGRRAVVVLTDGIDNRSRRRVEEVIARAKEMNVALYMLGFGRPGELDEKVMKAMAD